MEVKGLIKAICMVMSGMVIFGATWANNISLSGSCSTSYVSDCSGLSGNQMQVSGVSRSECTDIEHVMVEGDRCYDSCRGQCAAGYYLSEVTRVVPGHMSCTITFYYCAPCPLPGTSSGGSTSQTSCYIPSGNTGSDTTGSYKYTGNCYWKS